MKAVLHNEAIKMLLKIHPDNIDYIVIDQFAQREVYQHYALCITISEKQNLKQKVKISGNCSCQYLSLCICQIYGSTRSQNALRNS